MASTSRSRTDSLLTLEGLCNSRLMAFTSRQQLLLTSRQVRGTSLWHLSPTNHHCQQARYIPNRSIVVQSRQTSNMLGMYHTWMGMVAILPCMRGHICNNLPGRTHHHSFHASKVQDKPISNRAQFLDQCSRELTLQTNQLGEKIHRLSNKIKHL